jgi:hypothetical protein
MNVWAAVTIAQLVLAASSTTAGSQDAAVLKAALADLCEGNYLILDSSNVAPSQGTWEPPGFPTAAMRELWSRSRRPELLPLSEACPGTYVATQEEIKAAFDVPSSPGPTSLDWRWEDGFYKRFAGAWGLIRLSLPGYSRDGKTAVVYRERSRGALSASGELLLVRRSGKLWAVSQTIGLWVA